MTRTRWQRSKENVATYNAITAIGRRVSIAVCDLANDQDVKGLTKRVTGSKEEGGMGHTIDILVNCGGIQRRCVERVEVGRGTAADALRAARTPAENFSDQDWDEVSPVSDPTSLSS